MQSGGVFRSRRLLGINGWAVDLDVLGSNDLSDLSISLSRLHRNQLRTMYLKLCRSSWVIVSALAMTGIRLTLVPSLFIISTSRGLTLLVSCARFGAVASLRSSRLDKV